MADSLSSVLEERIASLSDLYSQIQALRQIPPSLLKRHAVPALAPPGRAVAADFQQVKDVAAFVRSEPIQAALVDAERRIRTDDVPLDTNYRRENRKRRRPPSPESPKPYVPLERVQTSYFLSSDEHPAVTLDGLVAFTREFNRTQKTSRLHIWARTKEERREERPRTMRFMIPDILTAYIGLSYAGADNTVLVQTVTVFGPSERKAPHTQSEFGVFRLLTQEIGKMIRSEEQVGLRTMTGLLCGYNGLFVEPCTACNSVLSREGHAPPVLRLAQREPRHVTCLDQ